MSRLATDVCFAVHSDRAASRAIDVGTGVTGTRRNVLKRSPSYGTVVSRIPWMIIALTGRRPTHGACSEPATETAAAKTSGRSHRALSAIIPPLEKPAR